MRTVLDTSALSHPRAIEALDPFRVVVVPSVVFLERSRQLAREERMQPAAYLATLRANGWEVEPFGPDEAVRSKAQRLKDTDWRRICRDAMIVGHVREGDELWTATPRDFQGLGVASWQIVDVTTLP